MSLRWFLIIMAVGFLLYTPRADFLPKSKTDRGIVIALVCFLILLGLVVAWMLLPFA